MISSAQHTAHASTYASILAVCWQHLHGCFTEAVQQSSRSVMKAYKKQEHVHFFVVLLYTKRLPKILARRSRATAPLQASQKGAAAAATSSTSASTPRRAGGCPAAAATADKGTSCSRGRRAAAAAGQATGRGCCLPQEADAAAATGRVGSQTPAGAAASARG